MSKENKYQNSRSIEQLETELKELEDKVKGDVEAAKPADPDTPKEPKTVTAEDESWKKRYSDLRSFAAKKEADLKTQLDEERRQREALANKEMKFPKTKEEVSEWAAKYPDIYATIVTISKQNAIEVNKNLDDRLQELTKKELQDARKEAYKALLALHPDFTDLKDTDDFQSWVEQQPIYIYNALYENETDAIAAARAVDLYKADMAKTKAPKNETRDAARSVKTPSSSGPDSDPSLKWTESKVASISWREFEKHEAEIDAAMLNPAFYDLSGAAR